MWIVHCLVVCLASVAFAIPVDVSLNKPITAKLTCGFDGTEQYYGHSDMYNTPSARNKQYCDNVQKHAPESMVDEDSTTWWQSTSRYKIYTSNEFTDVTGLLEAVIVLDLQKEFVVETIALTIGDAKRPKLIGLQKSYDDITYLPWAYKVTFASDCSDKFGIDFPTSDPGSDTGKLCELYTNPSPASRDEVIIFDFSGISLHNWKRTKFIRIMFYDMYITWGLSGTPFQHYSVTNLVVMAECSCNGQQTGCEKSIVTEQYECICGGNTQGEFCSQCQPLYNQKEYAFGKACEACNCFSHSAECYFNTTVAQSLRSINAAGLKEGGGVCLACRNNTSGINCEKCAEYYYRPVNVIQTQDDACRPCDCHSAGIVANPDTGLTGDCVMNNDNFLPLGMAAGDCFCKTAVTGSLCDTCFPGFFDLTEDKAAGCQDCQCNLAGTVGRSNECIQDNTGQCPCKTHTTGRRCDECQDGYYGLDVNEIDGCLPCDCDIGGSTSSICDKLTGQCKCRRHINERRCSSPEFGYYYPTLHYMHVEAETFNADLVRERPGFSGYGYAVLSNNSGVDLSLTIFGGMQLSGDYNLFLKYFGSATVTVQLTLLIAGVQTSYSYTLPACAADWCSAALDNGQPFSLESGRHSLMFSADDIVLLDRVVALPTEFTNPTFFGDQSSEFLAQCDVLNVVNSDVPSDFCLGRIFSLTTYHLDGTLSCDCDVIGGVSTTCTPYGGQCECRQGITQRQCSQCQAEYFGFSLEGCTACGCTGVMKICNRITGQCQCPPNVVGLECNVCSLHHWNWDNTTGCQPCNCDVQGAYSQQCDPADGACMCLPGVQGEMCDSCELGYTSLSATGCSPCSCDESGSIDTGCDGTTGQCSCKVLTDGMLCDRCTAGSFYLSSDHDMGCLQCVCMGITQECQSTDWFILEETIALVGETLVNRTLMVVLTDNTGAESGNNILFNSVNTTSIESELTGMEILYWKVLYGLDRNLLAIYGSDIQFDVFYTPQDVGDGIPDPKAILIGQNGARLVFAIDQIPKDQSTTVNVQMTESYWRIEGTNEIVSRDQFLLLLADVRMILFPATFYDALHTTRLSGLKYQTANMDTIFGMQALSVEQCTCGSGYTGLSCEKCASGYKRSLTGNEEYLGLCELCECNNHGDYCDEETGECSLCDHNTTGFNCDQCQAGFYGDATRGTPVDCTLCPCFDPRVANASCEVRNEVVTCLFCNEGYTGDQCDQCSNFYFGNPDILATGRCDSCDCNNNADVCDIVTGMCQNCNSDTIGLHCERCLDEFYGNASTQTCQPCGCIDSGSQSPVCDLASGQCECYSGISSRDCSQCEVGYWGFTDALQGCVPCSCNEAGSETIQCDDMSGICTCRPSTMGDACDMCADNQWGLPTVPCSGCDCNIDGTVDPTLPCDAATGICACKPGVMGRQCDACEHMYVGFSITGCQTCDLCQTSLGNDTARLQVTWEKYWNVSLNVEKVQKLDSVLEVIAVDLNTTVSELGPAGQSLDDLSTTITNRTTEAETIDSTVNTLIRNISIASATASEQLTFAVSSSGQHDQLLTENERLYDQCQLAQKTTFSQHETLIELNATAIDLLNEGLMYIDTLNISFTKELEEVQLALPVVQNISLQVAPHMTKIEAQVNETSNLLVTTSSVNDRLSVSETSSEQLIQQATTLEDSLVIVQQNVTDTQYHIDHIASVFDEANNILTYTESLMEENTASFEIATQAFSDAELILEGSPTGNLPLGNLTIDLTGVTSWRDAADDLDLSITSSTGSLDSVDPGVAAATTHAEQLSLDYVALLQDFQNVKHLGQPAVDAITTYEEVTATLDTSRSLAEEANSTYMEAQQIIQDVTLEALLDQTMQARTDSETLRNEVNNRNYQPEILSNQLDNANASYQAMSQLWADVNTKLTDVSAQAEKLLPESVGFAVNALLSDGHSTLDAAKSLAASVLTENKQMMSSLTSIQTDVVVVQTRVNNASILVTQIQTNLSNYELSISRIDDQAKNIERIQQQTTTSQNILQQKLDAIELKLLQAQRLAEQMKQPIRFSGNNELSFLNPSSNRNLEHNEISLEFKKTAGNPDGLLFFAECNVTGAELAIELLQGAVVFEYNLNVDHVRIVSPAVICDNCWAKVLASRYKNTGQLSVTLLSTGGVATSTGEGLTSSISHMMINSSIFMGGLPTDYQTTKVTSRGFHGCMSETTFDGATLDIWKETLHSSTGGNVQCCTKPVVPATQQFVPGISFAGFGHLRIPSGNLNVSTASTISLKFRTFADNAVILLLDKENLDAAYYGIYLETGRVVFQFANGGIVNRLQSLESYSDGKWYKVTASHSAGQVELLVEPEVIFDAVIPDRQTLTETVASLVDLGDADITLGGPHPNRTLGNVHGPSVRHFSGCLKEFRHTVGLGLTMEPHSMQANIISQQDVLLSGCYVEVVDGLGLNSIDSFAQLDVASELSVLQRIEISLATTEPFGILAYSRHATDTATEFYLALYHGYVLASVSSAGQFSHYALHNTDLYVSDGKLHTVALDISSTRIVLTVDADVLEGTDDLPQSFLVTSSLYVGGVPSTVSLGAHLPVVQSIIGGITSLTINAFSATFLQDNFISQHRSVYLSGVPRPKDTTPPPPFPTEAMPTPAPILTCQSPPAATYADQGVWFGQTHSYLKYTLSTSEKNMFASDCLVEVDFQSFAADGVMVYIANANSDPVEWIGIYMIGGHIGASVKAASSDAVTVLSQGTYNDGALHNLVMIKNQNLVTLVIMPEKDITSQTLPASSVQMDTDLYIGGVDSSIQGTFPLTIGKIPFVGCMSLVNINTTVLDSSLQLNLSNPTLSSGTGKCYSNAYVGVRLSGAGSYIKLVDNFNLTSDDFSVSITLRADQKSTNLFTLYQSEAEFIVLDLVDGELRSMLSNSEQPTHPFISVLRESINICDYSEYTVTWRITQLGVTLDIDARSQSFLFPTAYLRPTIESQAVYIGGLEDASLLFPEPVSTDSFTGCIQQIVINDVTYSAREAVKTSGLSHGCPY